MQDCLELIYRKSLTSDLAVFRFGLPDGSFLPDFQPGQFVALGLDIEGKRIFRDYSITSIPSEKNYYEFYIKHKEHPTEGKFTTILFQMELGSKVFWQKPRGVFTIEEGKPKDDLRQMILVATGTGLAPFVSYIRYLRTVQKPKKAVLLHGVSFAAELGYSDILEETSAQTNSNLSFTYIPTVSRPNTQLSKSWTGNTGRVESFISGIETHSSKLENVLNSKITPENSIFYLCGYKNMIDSVTDMLTAAGFASMRNKRGDGTFDIKFELFGI